VNGTGGTPKTAFYRHQKNYVALLKIEGKTVRKVAQAEVSGLAEDIAFSPDGRYLYVGTFVDGNIDILRLDGDALTKVASFAMRGSTPSVRPFALLTR
jgi:Tol biopolymer transport system component